MRSFPLAALLVAAALPGAAASAAPAAASAPGPSADWRRAGLDAGVQDALKSLGYGLEDDGRVLDPATRAPLDDAQLKEAVTRLGLSSQRLALERLSVLLAGGPLTPDGRRRVEALKGDLPDSVVRALDANRSLADLRAVTDGALAQAAAYFDASRTLADARTAAAPVRAGTPGPRPAFPYLSAGEQSLGDSLRAAAAARLGADPYGRALLAKLDGPGGKPDLPPIVVEDAGGSAALYEYRRGVVVLDRESLLDEATGAVAPKDRVALRRTLSSPPALTAYLNAHPALVADFAARNDVVIFHELVHAWQDRRDGAMREMARGVLPDSLLLGYEQEAWTMKNLYLQSKLKNEPGSVVDDAELDDYRAMMRDPAAWSGALRARYAALSPVQAMDFPEAQEVARRRAAEVRARAVSTGEQQRVKALDLLAMTRAERVLADARAAGESRLAADAAAVAAARASSSRLLALHYLAEARAAGDRIDFSVAAAKAARYAREAGDRALLAEILAQKGPS